MSRNKKIGWSVYIAPLIDAVTCPDHEVEVRWFLTRWRANRFWYRAIRDLHESYSVKLNKR